MKKKIHLVILLTSLCVYQIIANLLASNDSLAAYGNTIATPYLWVTPTSYVATELGETFTIDISISNVDNLRAFEFKLSYNTTLLDAVQVAQGPFFSAPQGAFIIKLETNETTGLVWVNMSLSDLEASKSSSGTLATVTFIVTFAPSSPSRTWCVLDLQESVLYDSAKAQIPHDSIDGLYFWKTVLDDPSGTGLKFDLTTQKGGIGPNVTDGTFILGEVVDLIGYLTYNGDPVENKFVSFEVRNPLNEVVLPRVAITDKNGYAVIRFRIPALLKSIGTWTVISMASVSEQNVWDRTSFKVEKGPVGGYTTLIKEEHVPILQMDIYSAILAIAVSLAITITRMHRIVKTSLKH